MPMHTNGFLLALEACPCYVWVLLVAGKNAVVIFYIHLFINITLANKNYGKILLHFNRFELHFNCNGSHLQ